VTSSQTITAAAILSVLLCTVCAASPQQQTKSRSKTYSNSRCGFSFNYPDALTVTTKIQKDDPEYLPYPPYLPRCHLEITFRGKGWRKHHVKLQVEQKDFNQAAEDELFEKSDEGWVFQVQFKAAAVEIQGENWKGLSAMPSTRCYGDSGYKGLGEGLTAFASSGNRTIVIDGDSCEDIDEKAFAWVTKSLKFLPARKSRRKSS
jgi:hypothetical protein